MAEQQDTVLVDLTDEERAARAFELAAKTQEVLKLEAERTATNRDFTAKLKKLKERIRECAQAYESGQEHRPAQKDMFDNGRAAASFN